MTEIRTLVTRMFDAIDNARYDQLTTAVWEDVEHTNPMATMHSAAEWAEFSRNWATAVPDGRHTVTRVLQDGDWGAIEGSYRGTHTGPLQTPQGELPATGRSVELAFGGFGHVRDGRLDVVHVYMDLLSVMAQLGQLSEPAGAAS